MSRFELDLDQRHWTRSGDLDVFEKCSRFDQPERLKLAGVRPFFPPIDWNDGPTASIGGRRVLMLGSNNYLGLTSHESVKQASAEAVLKWGTGGTGSRILSGSLEMQDRLEERLAEFVGKERALIFSTGYQTSIGVLTALASKDDSVVLDKYAHASLNDGATLSRGDKLRFKHNDVDDLRRVILPLVRGRSIIVVEGVYSMGGDLGDLRGITRVAKEVGARTLVDDAHGLGVIGLGGRGSCSHLGVTDDVDLIMGTLFEVARLGWRLRRGPVAGDRIHQALRAVASVHDEPASLLCRDRRCCGLRSS